jgi:hypothetical protein
VLSKSAIAQSQTFHLRSAMALVIPRTLKIIRCNFDLSINHYDWHRMLTRMVDFGSSGVHVKGPLKRGRGSGHARARKEIDARHNFAAERPYCMIDCLARDNAITNHGQGACHTASQDSWAPSFGFLSPSRRTWRSMLPPRSGRRNGHGERG